MLTEMRARLNLTVASRIHIIEPQWNPSVEEQAIARAVRMGQKREVVIFQYVLQNTVEQVSLQSYPGPVFDLAFTMLLIIFAECCETAANKEETSQVHAWHRGRSEYFR